MKIEQVNRVAGNKLIDTDKLSDISALIMEKSEELLMFCRNNGKQCFLLVESGANPRADTFINMKKDSLRQNPNATLEEYQRLLTDLSDSIYYLSNGQFSIKANQPPTL